jgi:hypothetical protein
MTFLREIQELLERTYWKTGVNLEDCVVGRNRAAQLSRLSRQPAEILSSSGRTFLRLADNRLYMGIYYADSVIEQLERNDPRRVLNHHNITPLITFIEEISHGVAAARMFQRGRRRFGHEAVLRNLEAQAKVDTYLVLSRLAHRLLGADSVPRAVGRWLERQVFDTSFRRFGSRQLRERYAVSQRVARSFICHLRKVPATRRQEALRAFHRRSWRGKLRYAARVS